MQEAGLITAIAAGLAVIVVSIRLYIVARQAQVVLARLSDVVDVELRATIRSWGDTAQGVQNATRKLDAGLEALGAMLSRFDRLTAKLEPEIATLSVIQPAIAKLSSWLGGVRKGLAGVVGHHGKVKVSGNGVETEAG